MHELGDGDGELGLIHRDLSPENIIISTSGAAKLIDFGAARATARTQPGRLFVGKYRYAAPERIAQPRREDRRSDVYSAGVVLYECLVGRRPFEGDGRRRSSGQRPRRPFCDPAAVEPSDAGQRGRRRPEGDRPAAVGPFRQRARAGRGAVGDCLAELGASSKERDVTAALSALLDAEAGTPSRRRWRRPSSETEGGARGHRAVLFVDVGDRAQRARDPGGVRAAAAAENGVALRRRDPARDPARCRPRRSRRRSAARWPRPFSCSTRASAARRGALRGGAAGVGARAGAGAQQPPVRRRTCAGCGRSSRSCDRPGSSDEPRSPEGSLLDAQLPEHHAEGRVRDAGQPGRLPAFAGGRHLRAQERLAVASLGHAERQAMGTAGTTLPADAVSASRRAIRSSRSMRASLASGFSPRSSHSSRWSDATSRCQPEIHGRLDLRVRRRCRPRRPSRSPGAIRRSSIATATPRPVRNMRSMMATSGCSRDAVS